MTTLAICDNCGLEAADTDLYLCALSVPWAERHECGDCQGECSPCISEAAKEWQYEHGGRGA